MYFGYNFAIHNVNIWVCVFGSSVVSVSLTIISQEERGMQREREREIVYINPICKASHSVFNYMVSRGVI